MTIDISNNDPRISYTVGAGVTQTSFAVPFEFFDDSDVNVYVNEVLKTITTDYTISGGDGSTGTVTISVTGPATVTLTRNITIERVTDFPTGIDINRAALNTQLDTLTAIAADLKDEITRNIRISDADTATNLTLPSASNRADKVLSFDTEGNVQTQNASDLFSGSILGANYVNNTATGDGSTVAFGVSVAPGSKNNIQIYIDGVYQNKATFSISGTTVTFSEAPPLNAAIEFIIGAAVTSISGDADGITYTQGGTGSQQRTVELKLQEFVSVKDFGAVGDGVSDDTAEFQAAIDHCKTNGLILHVNPGTYKLTSTLDMNDGYDNAVSLVGMGGFSNEPVLEFQDGVTIGLLVKNSKNTLIQDLSIDISNITNDAVGVLWYGVWHSKVSNVIVRGAGKTDPASNPTHYGIALRPTYNAASVTSKASAVDLEAILSAATATNQGVYWNIFERLDIGNCSYGLTLYGGEGGTNPRTNQNQFNSCKINSNWFNIILDGAGGGNTFISCTAEQAGDTAVLVESMSSGTTPVWIAGELSDANNNKWKGQGLLLGAVAGTGFPKANSSGYQGTNFRFSDQGPQLEGQKLTGVEFLSDWNTKQDVPVSGSGTMSSKTFDMATIAPDGGGSDAIAYEFSVILTDSVSPQGSSIMIYHILLNRGLGQPLSGGIVKISERTEWFNLSGGTVAPTITMSIVSDVATVTANLNWDSVGADPGEPVVTYKIRQMNEVSAADWTLTPL